MVRDEKCFKGTLRTRVVYRAGFGNWAWAATIHDAWTRQWKSWTLSSCDYEGPIIKSKSSYRGSVRAMLIMALSGRTIISLLEKRSVDCWEPAGGGSAGIGINRQTHQSSTFSHLSVIHPLILFIDSIESQSIERPACLACRRIEFPTTSVSSNCTQYGRCLEFRLFMSVFADS